MAQAIGKFAAQKLLKNQFKQYQGKKVEGGDVSPPLPVNHIQHTDHPCPQDPYFAMIEDPRRPGKFKKVKKQIPAYIPEHDALILASVRKNAYRLDMSLFNFLGMRFGWEAVIGIVPMAGDAIGVALAYLLFMKACKVEGGLPNSVKTQMLIYIALDFCIGLVPILGDLADAAFKCNTKNCRLLEVHLENKYRPQASRRDERDLAGVDREKRRKNRQSGIYHPQDPPPATVFEDYSDEEDDRRDFVRDQGAADRRVQQPQPTRAAEERRGGDRGGWFSAPRKAPQPDRRDVDMAQAPVRDNRYRQETGSVRR